MQSDTLLSSHPVLSRLFSDINNEDDCEPNSNSSVLSRRALPDLNGMATVLSPRTRRVSGDRTVASTEGGNRLTYYPDKIHVFLIYHTSYISISWWYHLIIFFNRPIDKATYVRRCITFLKSCAGHFSKVTGLRLSFTVLLNYDIGMLDGRVFTMSTFQVFNIKRNATADHNLVACFAVKSPSRFHTSGSVAHKIYPKNNPVFLPVLHLISSLHKPISSRGSILMLLTVWLLLTKCLFWVSFFRINSSKSASLSNRLLPI